MSLLGGTAYASDLYSPENINQRTMEDEIVYFVIPDRFYNGDPSNDKGGLENTPYERSFNPKDKGFFHGGDIVGLEQKLDYIQGLGATAIWMAPILKNLPLQVGPDGKESAAYHGYWTIDFTNVDSHFGTNDELQRFIDAAHRRGIKVFFDIITNHTADVIKYTECHDAKGGYLGSKPICPYQSSKEAAVLPYHPFIPAGMETIKKPAWLNDIKYYHNQGDTTFAGEDALNGDFEGMDDIKTEDPFVIKGMVEIFKKWIDIGVDGFRIDTVRNVNVEFWNKWTGDILDYAKSKGKPHFFMFGEVYDYSVENRSDYTTRGNLPSVFDFGFQGVARSVMSVGEASEAMNFLFTHDDYYIDKDSNAYNLVNFLGNHDMGRFGFFLKQDLPDASEAELIKRFDLAHAFMYFARGIPVIYYGDEQGFIGDGLDRDAREDMMATQTPSYLDNHYLGTNRSPAEDKFDTQHPLYRKLRTYADLYKQFPALRSGLQYERYLNKTKQKADTYVFSRLDPDTGVEYLLAFNPGQGPSHIQISATAAGYEQIYSEDDNLLEVVGDQLNIALQPLSFAIWKANSPVPPTSLAQVTLAFNDLVANDVISTRTKFEVAAKGLPADKLNRVSVEYAIKTPKAKEFVPVGVDYSSPYRLYWNPDGYDNNQTIILKATMKNGQGEEKSITMPLIVDRRTPEHVTVHYQNGNHRKWAYAVSDVGAFDGPFALDDKGFSLPWRPSEKTKFVYFADDVIADGQIDKPILLTRADMVRNIKTQKQGITAELFVDNQGHVKGGTQATGQAGKPATLTSHFAPLDGDFFLRGSLNGWSAADKMEADENGRWHVTRLVKPGDTEFKFADAEWQRFNRGGPYIATGLSGGDNPANLNHKFDRKELMTFNFYSMKSDDGKAYQFHTIVPELGPLPSPLMLTEQPKAWTIEGPLRFAYQDGGHYELAVMVTQPGEYHFGLSSFAAQDASAVKLDRLIPLTQGAAGDFKLSFAEAGLYLLKVNVEDPKQPTLLIAKSGKADEFGPLGKQLFIRGSINGWGVTQEIPYRGGQIYSQTLYLPQGLSEFKLADETWNAGCNIGAKGTKLLQLGQPNLLFNDAESDNLRFETAQGGVYKLELNVAQLKQPVLTLEELSQAIVHFYLPSEKKWGTEFVDLNEGDHGVESWYIEALDQYFPSQEAAEKALQDKQG
ncbi:alpha-amylase family glycosyl hydrolase [Pseudaeromonas paramecii]